MDASCFYAYDQDIFGNVNGDVYIPFNMLEERANTSYTLDNKSVKTVMDLSYQIHRDLNIRTEFGLQFEDTGLEKFGGKDSYYLRKLRESSRYFNPATKKMDYFLPAGGTIYNQNSSAFQYNWKSIMEYKTVIADKHEIEALAGSELRRTNKEAIDTRGFGYNEQTLTNENIIFPNASFAKDAKFRAYQKAKLENAYASFFGTLSYTYDRKYTLYGSIRYDGSDLFGVDPKYRYLPIYALSGAWNASEEKFIKDLSWISNLRVRTSYGLQGNIDKNTSPFVVGAYGSEPILPGGNQPVISVDRPPNTKLRWEKTATFNAGLDLGMFNNALQVTFDYYKRDSKDLIGTEALQLENGFDFTRSNGSRVKNNGLELTISTRNISTSNFQWWTDFNIAHNKNKVVKDRIRPNQLTPSREGYPLDAIFAIKTAGLDKDGIPQFNRDGKIVSYEEFFKLFDPLAGVFDGELTSSALDSKGYRDLYSYVGTESPKFTGGLTNRFRYSNFDLAVTAIFNIKQWVNAKPAYNPAIVDRGRNYSKDILNAWSPTNTGSNLPAIFGNDTYGGARWMAYKWLNGNDPSNTYNSLDIFAKEISYVRVSSIRLGYTMPSAISSKVKANSLRISLEARNPFVFGTSHKGFFDPETYGNLYAQPITKSISIGLNATF